MLVLTKTVLGADDDHDMVVIRLGDLRPRIPYQVAFEIEQAIRVACKGAARSDRVRPRFWQELVGDDLDDCPKAHRGFRRSLLAPNVRNWSVVQIPPMVKLVFDDRAIEFDYQEGIRLGHCIRRAGRRAKAWAGDTSRNSAMLGLLTDAEDDDRLGLI